MEIIRKKKRDYAHPYIPELESLYRQGRITRREFLRNATLLGMSLGAASLIASCAPDEPDEPVVVATDTPEPVPTDTPVPVGPQRGGVMTQGQQVRGIDHPARYSWITGDANITRFMIEHLGVTDKDNITHPHLLESWEASDDLLTWTLNLRQNVTWSTGEPFIADDVIFTIEEWLDVDVGSSMLGLMGDYLTADNVERVDDHTVRLHLDSPQIAVPEHLYHYAAPVVDHRTFEGDWLENPVGTGPFVLEEWTVGERAVLKARDGYWLMGEDGEPLPYLDELRFIDLGEEETAYISAILGGEIDTFYPLEAPSIVALRDEADIELPGIATGDTRVLRMRVDREPFTDNRVRTAIKMCLDRQKILDLAYFGEGVTGGDYHVAPVTPAHSDAVEPLPFDREQARAILADAGFPDGLDVELTVGSGWLDAVSFGETLREDAEPAGIRIAIRSVPTSVYWDEWTEVDFGITPWAHRPLAVMTLPLGYICDRDGNPVPWNETRWCDEEFTELLLKAQGTLDVEQRREIMHDIQVIQRDRGSIGIPYWRNRWIAYRKEIKGLLPHPTAYNDIFVHAWRDPLA